MTDSKDKPIKLKVTDMYKTKRNKISQTAIYQRQPKCIDNMNDNTFLDPYYFNLHEAVKH